jgi:hypothetical protein
MRAIKARSVWGHLEHPKDGRPDLKEAAIIITDLQLKENGEIWGTLETLRTQAGKTAAALFEDGLSIGVSSRAHGSTKRLGSGVDEVMEDFEPETFDLVAEPSTPGAVLHESLQKTLNTLGEDAVRKEEAAELCYEKLSALQEEITKEGWNPTWDPRLSDAKFLAERSSRKNELCLLVETLKTLVRHTKRNIGDSVMKRSKKVVYRNGRMYEEEIPISTPIDTPPSVDTAVATTKVTFLTNFSVALDALGEDIKKKFNLFRPGESLETLVVLIKSELSSRNLAPKEIVALWKDNVIELSLELEKNESATPEAVQGILCTIFAVSPAASSVPVVDATIPVLNNVQAPEEPQSSLPPETIVEPTTESYRRALRKEMGRNESIKSRSVAQNQYQKSLQEEISSLRKKNLLLQNENTNLKIINTEMAKIFEEKVTGFELGSILAKTPELHEFRSILAKCKTLPKLQETTSALLQALRKKPSMVVKERRKGVPMDETISKPKLVETTLKPASHVTDEPGRVKTVPDIFTRLADHKSRK